MPQLYKQKTQRSSRSTPELLSLAAEERKKGASLRKVADMFGLDKMTVENYQRTCFIFISLEFLIIICASTRCQRLFCFTLYF